MREWLMMSLPIMMLAVAAGGCGGDDDDGDDDGEFDPAVCQPDQGPFTLGIDNEYFPLPVGLELALEGDDDGTVVHVDITVLDETEVVAGVTCRVVEEAEYEDEEVVEISRNFFVQAADGTVCYYGEDVDIYEGGAVVAHDGAWRAGDGDNLPGVMMPGTPAAGQEFAQESAPAVAEDMSAIAGVGETITTAAGEFADAVHAIDWNPLEGDTKEDAEDKYYAKGIGLAVDDVVELISYSGN